MDGPSVLLSSDPVLVLCGRYKGRLVVLGGLGLRPYEM